MNNDSHVKKILKLNDSDRKTLLTYAEKFVISSTNANRIANVKLENEQSDKSGGYKLY